MASWAAAAKSHIDQRLHWIGRVLDEFEASSTFSLAVRLATRL
ncbi:MAG: hypothetical protein R2683_04480 [Bifidobacterium adolescentis]